MTKTMQGKFLGAAKTNSSTGNTGATSLTPVGESFMYIQTSGFKFVSNPFFSFERGHNIQIKTITFYFIRY